MGPVHFEVVTADVLDDTVRSEIITLCESAYGEDFSQPFDELPGSITSSSTGRAQADAWRQVGDRSRV